MHPIPHATFNVILETAPNEPHPPGAALAKRLQDGLRAKFSEVGEYESWRDCGWSMTIQCNELRIQVYFAPYPDEGNWLLAISPMNQPGLFARLLSRNASPAAAATSSCSRCLAARLNAIVRHRGKHLRMTGVFMPRPKFIASMTLRGFDMEPGAVETLMEIPAALLVQRGEARVPGGVPFARSAASWSMEFNESNRIEDLIPALLTHLGGVAHLSSVKSQVSPEFFEFDIAMWILDSTEQEGGSVGAPAIAALAELGASLSLGFYAKNAA